MSKKGVPMKQINIAILALYLLAISVTANAEIKQEYYFFPIGTWLIPPCYGVSTTGINTDTFNAPPSTCYSMFDDFKLDWVRFALSFSGTRTAFWTDRGGAPGGGPDHIPDEFQCDLKYLDSFASTGVRAQLQTRSLANRISAFRMIMDYTYPVEVEIKNLPKMRYPTGIFEGEGVTPFPERYGPDGVFQYFHPFKNNGIIYPTYYENEYPKYDTYDHNVYSNDQYNYDAFKYHTVTLYEPPSFESGKRLLLFHAYGTG